MQRHQESISLGSMKSLPGLGKLGDHCPLRQHYHLTSALMMLHEEKRSGKKIGRASDLIGGVGI